MDRKNVLNTISVDLAIILILSGFFVGIPQAFAAPPLPSISLGSSFSKTGDVVSVTGTNFHNGDTISITITGHSGDIGSSPTVSDGSFSGTITLPLDATEGLDTVMASDTHGNSASATITFDNTAPTGTISINNDATHTNDSIVTLTLSATDNLSDVLQMRFSNGGTYSEWELYATTKTWLLSPGDGNKTVRVDYIDSSGNYNSYGEGSGIPATIILDTILPVITLLGDNPVNLTVGDPEYIDDGATALDNGEVDLTENIITTFTPGPVDTSAMGLFTAHYNVFDAAGNPAVEVTRIISVNPPVTHTLTYVAGLNGSIDGISPQTVNDGTDGSAVTAVPDADYHFTNWSDGSTDNPRTDINVIGDISVMANFEANPVVPSQYFLMTSASTGGMIDPPGGLYDDGAEVQITAIPDGGYHFDFWSGDLSGSDNPATIMMDNDKSVTANFAADLNTAKEITSFVFPDLASGIIDEGTEIKTIVLTVPFRTDVTALVPNIEITGLSVEPGSGVAQDFTNPVIYTVTAEDDSTQYYTVTVNISPPGEDITPPTFGPCPSDTTGTTGETAIVRITAIDDIEVNNTQISINGGEYIIMTETPASVALGDPTRKRYTYEIAVPFDSTADITYQVEISDTAGNLTTSDIETITITDNDPPIVSAGADKTFTVNTLIIQEGTTTDSASGINDVLWTAVSGPEGGNIVFGSSDFATTTISADMQGTYVIQLAATDNSGNSTSSQATLTVLPENQIPAGGSVILSDTQSNVILDQNTGGSDTTIDVPAGVNDAQIDASSLLTGTDTKTVILQGVINVNASTTIGDVNIQIPADTQITASSSWTGIINMPQIRDNSSVTVTPDSGNTAAVVSVIEIGFADVKLTFDKAVRILLVGQANRYVGYSRGSVFTQITTTCASDDQASGDALPAEGDCKINSGSDLVVWTKHFTTFATYTQTSTPATASAPSGGGGNGMMFQPPPYPVTNTPVLLAQQTAPSTQVLAEAPAPELNQALVQEPFSAPAAPETANQPETAVPEQAAEQAASQPASAGLFGGIRNLAASILGLSGKWLFWTVLLLGAAIVSFFINKKKKY